MMLGIEQSKHARLLASTRLAGELDAAIAAGSQVVAIIDPASYRAAWMSLGTEVASRGGFSLFADTPQAQEAAVAPLVFPLRPADTAALMNLIDIAFDAPAVVWLASPFSIAELAAALAKKLQAELADDRQPITLRFYDPRVLPALLKVLDVDQQQHLNAGIQSWWWLDRKGSVSSAAVNGDANDSEQTTLLRAPIALTEDQVQALFDESFVDRVMDILTRDHHDRFQAFDRAQRFIVATALIAEASAWGVGSEFDCASYIAVALQEGPRFPDQPEWAELMLQVRAGTLDFTAAVEQWEARDVTSLQR
jgi:hypothetical protein